MPHPVLYSRKFKNVNSFLFDGVNETINIDSTRTSLATTTKGTWSAWVRVVDATPVGTQVFICFGDTDANSLIDLNIQGSGVLLAQCIIAASSKWILNTDAAAFSDNTWVHIALVHDGVSPVLFVNAISVAQAFSTSLDKTVWFNNIAGLDNGRLMCRNYNNAGNGNFVNGNMDECSIWNTNLSATQISEIYNGGKPGNLKKHSAFANLVDWYRGDGAAFDGTNFTIPNSSGNNSNTGTSVNMEANDLTTDVP